MVLTMAQQSPHGPMPVDRQLSFSVVDKDGSGTVELQEVQSALPQIPSDQVQKMFAEADRNNDGHLDREEYMSFLESLKTNSSNLVEALVLPRRERTYSRRAKQRAQGSLASPPVEIKKKFPFFIISVSLLEVIVFFCFMNDTIIELLVFNPRRRFEIWRFVTVMLLHGSTSHLWNNVIMQLILGCLLETIHGWKRVGAVYLTGVIFGTLASSVLEPWAFVVGASGGVYALVVAHFATIILNWNEMGWPNLRCGCLLGFVAFDVYLTVYREVVLGKETNTSHTGHFGGALAGLLIGINVLKNFEERSWEVKLRKICKCLAIGFLSFTVFVNVFFQIAIFIATSKTKNSYNIKFDNVTSANFTNEATTDFDYVTSTLTSFDNTTSTAEGE